MNENPYVLSAKSQQEAEEIARQYIENKISLLNIASQLEQWGIIVRGAFAYTKIHKVYSAAKLPKMDLQPTEFIVEGLLPVGLGIFAAPQKFGKSWAMIDLCESVAAGVPFWGYPTHKANTLYLDLESRENRIFERLKAMRSTFPEGMLIAHEANNLDHGFLAELESWLIKYSGIKLIVIDTIGRIKGAVRRGEDAYTADSRIFGDLQKFAMEHKLAILCITHLRKCVNLDAFDDPFAALQGSAGMTGVADFSWMIAGKRADQEKRFLITGRDLSSEDLTISFDSNAKKWSFLGDSEFLQAQRESLKYEQSPAIRTIRKLFEENGNWFIISKPDLYEKICKYTNQVPAETDKALGKLVMSLKGQLLEKDHVVVTDYIVSGKRCLKFVKQ